MRFTFNHTNLNVCDLEASLAFYQRALGLAPVREHTADDGSFRLAFLSDGKSWLAVTTADGAISLTDLQAAGKKRMNVRDFLAGFREPESWSLS